MIKYKLLYVCLVCPVLLFSIAAGAQSTDYYLSFFHDKERVTEKKFSDSLKLVEYLETELDKVQSKGYFTAGFDSIVFEGNQVNAYFIQGNNFHWGNVRIISNGFKLDSVHWLNEIRSKPPSSGGMQRVMQKLQELMMSEGYVNAEVLSRKLNTEKSQVDWEIVLQKNQKYTIDSIVVKSDDVFPPELLYYRYNLFPGSVFSGEKLFLLNEGSLNPSWLIPKEPANIEFLDSTCRVLLSYKTKKRNQVSGMLGIVPGDETENLYLTGDIRMSLLNAFHQAEMISFQWQSYQPGSQYLKIAYKQPVIIHAWGAWGNFNLQKQDTTFLNLKGRVGLNHIQFASEFNLFYDWFRTDLIQAGDTDSLQAAKHQKFGLSYDRSRLDYAANPHKGYRFFSEFAAGLRSGEEDDFIFDAELKFELYVPLKKRFSLSLDLQAASRYADYQLARNEMFRIGGLQTMRGYQELSIYTDSWAVLSLETLFFPDRESALYLFYDYGFLNKIYLNTGFERKILWSAGAGMKLNTDAGEFYLSLAIPRSDTSFFDYRISKIHLGYVNYF